MAVEVIMPKLEMAQDMGTVVRWLKAEGEAIRKGEPLLEIETDKVTVEIEAPGSGILSDISAREGDEVPVGQVIAQLLSSEERAPMAAPAGEAKRKPVEGVAGPVPAATPVAQRMAATHQLDLGQIAASGRRVTKQDVSTHLARQQSSVKSRLQPASPLARRLANEQGLDLSQIHGSGPEGAVRAADLRQVSETAAPKAEPVTELEIPQVEEYRRIPLRGIRKVVAQRLQQSYQHAPHISLTLTVDMTETERLMANLAEPIQQATGQVLTLTAVLARVTAIALSRHPRLNAHLVGDEEIREYESVHLGIAVALEDGLVVPVIRQAQLKGLAALQTELNELVSRARANKLALNEIKGSTFTLSNLGMYGIEQFTAIINPPEVGILAIGAITPGPKEIGGHLVMRPLMRLTLMVDHRAVDGAVGAQFLATLKHLLENPYRLLL